MARRNNELELGEVGLTLVEIIIASTILTTGLLAVLLTAALASRMMGEGAQATHVSTLARERLETLLDRGCTSAAAGDTAANRLKVSWRVTPGTAARVQVRVEVPTPRGVRVESFSSVLACPP
jgi:Tfp pilus assembly protein PilV